MFIRTATAAEQQQKQARSSAKGRHAGACVRRPSPEVCSGRTEFEDGSVTKKDERNGGQGIYAGCGGRDGGGPGARLQHDGCGGAEWHGFIADRCMPVRRERRQSSQHRDSDPDGAASGGGRCAPRCAARGVERTVRDGRVPRVRGALPIRRRGRHALHLALRLRPRQACSGAGLGDCWRIDCRARARRQAVQHVPCLRPEGRGGRQGAR